MDNSRPKNLLLDLGSMGTHYEAQEYLIILSMIKDQSPYIDL